MSIAGTLLSLYGREIELMSHGHVMRLSNAADDLSRAWQNGVTRGSIRHGLRVGCGGEAKQVISLLKGRCRSDTLNFFHIRLLSGYNTTHGLTAHVVTVVLPHFDYRRGQQSSSVSRTSYAARIGLVLDTWWYNAGFDKRVYSLRSYASDHGKNMIVTDWC